MNDVSIRGIALDSRKVAPGDLFIALSGEKLDGRCFIQQAIESGAAAVLTEKLSSGDNVVNLQSIGTKKSAIHGNDSRVPIIEYSDLKDTLGFIASRFYGEPSRKMPVIGITGTNGKTSCTHFIAQLSSFFGKRCAVVGTLGAGFLPDLQSFGLTTPDAIMLHSILADLQQKEADSVAIEVTSHALMQGRVSGLHFHTAIFTNLTRDHLDYHENFEAYFQAKLRLFFLHKPKHIILNLDDPYGVRAAELLAKAEFKPVIIGITTEEHIPTASKILVKDIISTHHLQMSDAGIQAEIRSPWGTGHVQCHLLGRFNLSNILISIAAVCLQGLPFSQVLSKLESLIPVAGRMNHLGSRANQPSVVIDYAHTPDALTQVLTALRPHCLGKLWCVFGCGGDRDPGKRPLMAQAAEQGSDNIIVTQDNPRTENPDQIIADILKGFSNTPQKTIMIEPDRAKAIALAIEQADPQDLIVIAGKGHETHQIIKTEKIPFVDEHYARSALERRHG